MPNLNKRSGQVDMYSPLHLQKKLGKDLINLMIAHLAVRFGDPAGWDIVRERWLKEDEQRVEK